MEVKIGDFGLATKVDYDGERKKTLCGTPNYIAPEVLGKKGHSYEVDVWSIGCILYTLLVGKPPFETQTLKDTYTRIKKNEYHIPSRVGPLAKNLIQKLLQHDPEKRPCVSDILGDDFMTMGYLPHRLPVSCLTMAPRFDSKVNASLIARRTPLMEVNHETGGSTAITRKDSARDGGAGPADCYLGELNNQLKKLVISKPGERSPHLEDEAEDPKSQPIVWVSKWVDYGGNEHYYTINEYPQAVEKKVKLLNYFRNYMKEHLLKAGANMEVREEDQLSRIPALKTWFRTSRAV